MAKDARQIHFGHFIHLKRAESGKKIRQVATDAGITEKRLIDIMKMPSPVVNATTLHGIARALGMTVDELDKAWRSTPVPTPALRRSGPGPSGYRTIRLPADIYEDLVAIAKERGRSADEQVAHMIRNSATHREVNPPTPQLAREETQEAEADSTRKELAQNGK